VELITTFIRKDYKIAPRLRWRRAYFAGIVYFFAFAPHFWLEHANTPQKHVWVQAVFQAAQCVS